jgi:hypothetical protein
MLRIGEELELRLLLSIAGYFPASVGRNARIADPLSSAIEAIMSESAAIWEQTRLFRRLQKGVN